MDEMQAIEIVIGSTIIGLVVTMIKLAFGRINKVEDKVVLREHCKERHEHLEASVLRNSGNIDKLFEKIDKMNDILIRVDMRVGEIARKDGIT